MFKSKCNNSNFTNADLRGANLIGANLTDSYFGYTILTGANLTKSNLKNTNFEYAHFYGTVFGVTNLSDTLGLARCIHRGQSIIDFQTLNNSKELPKEFLLGIGLNNWQIEFSKLNAYQLSDKEITAIFNRVIELRSTYKDQYYSCVY